MLSPAATTSKGSEMQSGPLVVPTEGSEMQSGPLVVAETDSNVESYQPDSRKKKTRQSPFKVPEDDSIFLLRVKEKEDRKEEQRKYLSLPVHEKLTYTGRMRAKQRELQTELSRGLDEEGEEKTERSDRLKGLRVRPGHPHGKPSLRIAMMKGENVQKESTLDFINRKREMFLMEYSLMVKRSEIMKLEDAAAAEEKRLTRAERALENDTVLFEEFLKENDNNSVEAIKIAEQETKSKLEKMAEIKRLTTEMVTMKSDISKNEEILKEYNMYKVFLFKLSPQGWQDAHRAKVQAAKVHSDKDVPNSRERDRETDTKSGRKRGSERKASGAVRELPPIRGSRVSSRQSVKSPTQSDKLIPDSKLDSDSSEYEDEPQLYFTEPQQLLDLLTELEEQNLSLIQNSRETEEALEELRHAMESSKKKMAQDAEQLTAQIDVMTQTIAREKERAAELELKARLFDFGKIKTGEQDNMLDALSHKVGEVYCCCVGDKKANLSTLQMLANIESRLSILLESIESIPKDTLEKVERIKDRERRVRQRDEKLQQQKEHQEERLKKALQRSQADIKKTSGKKLMSRSQPVARKIKFNNINNISEQDEIHTYFFT